MTKPRKRPPKPSRVLSTRGKPSPPRSESGDSSTTIMRKSAELAAVMETKSKCFACDGSGIRCNRCGETEGACGCEEGFDPGPCEDCEGTGK